jgi:hypothetical protein
MLVRRPEDIRVLLPAKTGRKVRKEAMGEASGPGHWREQDKGRRK